MKRPNLSLTLALAAVLAACAGKQDRIAPDPEPTLKSLAGRQVPIDKAKTIVAGEDKAIAAYKEFLAAAPRALQRAEAMRRLGDLEMDNADSRAADGRNAAGVPDYKAAIARYQEYLRQFPVAPHNDRVLYQLARAYELSGQLDAALKTLDRIVADYPNTLVLSEVQFRRGELLFTAREFAKAERAYATVLGGSDAGLYHERSLYMHGWSLFKQGRLEGALHSFFGVLDRKLAGLQGDEPIDQHPGLTRAERELVEDTFRVTSLSLQNLQGAETIPSYVNSQGRHNYEFRIYQQLAALYLRQERVKDAADTLSAFARQQPLHAQAPLMQTRVIEIYEQAGFAMLALEAKKQYVTRYGIDSEFRRANPQGWLRAQPLIKAHLNELARHYHASAQKTKAGSDHEEAARWYRAYIASFPQDPETPQNNFLLAELLYENKRLSEAAIEYEKSAYGYPLHARSADAGYTALLAYASLEASAKPADLPALQRGSVASAQRFAKAFPSEPRAAAVLTNAAEKLFALGDGAQASQVAQQVLALRPPAQPSQRRVAWTVISHTAFDRGEFDKAERGYGEVLALTPEKDAARHELVERLAASVYKQGEAARSAGDARAAVAHFDRVSALAPQSSVRAAAQYDAAAALLGLKDWAGATRRLEDFRQRFPKHPLQDEVSGQLALAYLEQQNWSKAAGEVERLADIKKDPKLAREALWQAAELHEKAGTRAQAVRVYERYLQQGPDTLERAIETRQRLANFAKADGDTRRELVLLKEIQETDLRGGAARTDRTRYLGGQAALALAEPALADYRKVALVEPLAKQLKLKKAKMEAVLKAYAAAAEYGVAEVTTAATFRSAALYQDFGKALMSSQRPKKLSKLELEQYNVMLEEQAFPFEERSTALHETNARRAADGIYDKWVKESYAALREMRPLRYGKSERSEGAIDAIR